VVVAVEQPSWEVVPASPLSGAFLNESKRLRISPNGNLKPEHRDLKRY
jgi:hypothetical protein